MKVTFLSKWTVLILTVITAVLIYGGVLLSNGSFPGIGSNALLAILAFIVAAVLYALAWFVGLFDSIQERRFGWTVALVILSPVLIGPLLYSLFGPKNTK